MLEAAYTCVAAYGIGKTTVEDVARRSGVSRATLYRYFPGGRDQVVREVVAWQAGLFFEQLAEAVDGYADLGELLVETLLFAHRAFLDHAVLQKVLETEPERLLPALTLQSDRVLAFVRAFLASHIRASDLRPGLEPAEATEYLGRLLLSYIGSPGRWDLTSREEVRRLVAREFLGAVS
ncbi:MAG TPA: TetR/AcrR family transcriptional regulator [Acidimicrobiales bacterium]|nr:TetR/AcrR family transcriptional regulator [Acidimicrobiales bacterium]